MRVVVERREGVVQRRGVGEGEHGQGIELRAGPAEVVPMRMMGISFGCGRRGGKRKNVPVADRADDAAHGIVKDVERVNSVEREVVLEM